MVQKLLTYSYLGLLFLVVFTSVFCLYYYRFQLPVIGLILIKRYYNSGAYDQDVQKICEKATHYFSTIPASDDSLIIFDVDDTAVYNLRFRAKTDLIKPKTVAILPVLNLYKYLISRGFKIIFLTSRDFCEDTRKELIDAGYTTFIDIICMTEFNDDNTAVWKAEKRKQLSQSYTIVGSIADRERDFFDNYNGHQVKLPNYLY